jgi:hypothetical protein
MPSRKFTMDCPRVDRYGVDTVRDLKAGERECERPEAMESEARPDIAVRQGAEGA